MRRLLSAVFPRASAKALRSAALLTLLLVLVAHGFCFTNLTYSGASVMLNAAKGSSAQISSGAFLLPIYWRIRGAIGSPLWVGLLSAAYLSLASALICGLFNLASPYLIAMLSGAMALSPSVLAAFAGSIHTADSLFLAVLLAVCAVVLCLRVRSNCLARSVLAGAQALDRCALAFFLSLTALCLLQSLLSDDEETPRAVLRRAVRARCCARRWAWCSTAAAFCCSCVASASTLRPRCKLRRAKGWSAHGCIRSGCSFSC